MRKLSCVLLAFVLVLSACGKKETSTNSGADNQTVQEIELPSKGKDLPSEELILQDVKTEILKSNPNILSVTSVETIKSITEETNFSIDLAVKAESKYSDFSYDVSLGYKKYDQGWFINASHIITNDSKLVRVPTDEEMIQFVNNDAIMLEDWDEVLPVNSGYILGEADLENGMLTFFFVGKEQYRHAYEVTEFTSLWRYNQKEEIWELEEADNHDPFVNRKTYYEMTADFTGRWENGEYGSKEYGYIDIVECSADQLKISWDGLNAPMTFRLSADPLYHGEETPDPKDYCNNWYTGENGYTMNIAYRDTYTHIFIYTTYSMKLIDAPFYITIRADLPALK